MNPRATPPDPRAGFTMTELLLVAVLGALVVAGAYGAILSQSRLSRSQNEISEARTTVRGASTLLSSALMDAAATDDDISALSDSSFTVRRYQLVGTVCSHVDTGTDMRYGVQELRGSLEGGVTAGDSVVVYDLSRDSWNAAALDAIWVAPAAWESSLLGGGTPVCFWGDSTTTDPRPQIAMRLDAPLSLLDGMGIGVGAPIRVFRTTEYGVFQRNAEWWLGRRVSGAASWELLTGPLVDPGSGGGVSLSYYKSDGTVATTGAEVAAVELFVWSRGLRDAGIQDSIRIRSYLRNNAGS